MWPIDQQAVCSLQSCLLSVHFKMRNSYQCESPVVTLCLVHMQFFFLSRHSQWRKECIDLCLAQASYLLHTGTLNSIRVLSETKYRRSFWKRDFLFHCMWGSIRCLSASLLQKKPLHAGRWRILVLMSVEVNGAFSICQLQGLWSNIKAGRFVIVIVPGPVFPFPNLLSAYLYWAPAVCQIPRDCLCLVLSRYFPPSWAPPKPAFLHCPEYSKSHSLSKQIGDCLRGK